MNDPVLHTSPPDCAWMVVGVQFDLPLFRALRDYALEQGVQMDTVIREAVRAYMGDA